MSTASAVAGDPLLLYLAILFGAVALVLGFAFIVVIIINDHRKGPPSNGG